jgi:hypothetical protein
MKMILGHNDDEDHGTNRRKEIERSQRRKHGDLLPSRPENDLEIHLEDGLKRLAGAILFNVAFDKPVLSNRLLNTATIGLKRGGETTSTTRKSRSTALRMAARAWH